MIPGIVGAIVVALGGAISSFIAYQKKKLCFKENGEGAHRHLLSVGCGYRILKKS